ncbi:hypothetical protein [Acinetobacter courvalinii]|uniref:hypothetical protein n=1 Tax=Acinetobacter courvalinii TaxID=280147 RepID=UPI0019007994|nr:hypothetical protein [Acinetobacter courvalinii]MBJ8418688.1 hypothetical protein [Acinetobacter courvalinii]
MLNNMKKMFVAVALLLLIGCNSVVERSCVNNFDKRVSLLTKDEQVIKAINMIDKSIFCSDGVYDDFYNNTSGYVKNLNKNQILDFYNVLFFAEFHRNENGGEYVEFLLKNKINISDDYKRKIGDNKILKEMHYSDEELSNIKVLGELF